MSVSFRAFRQLNDPRHRRWAGLRDRLDERTVERLLPPRDPPTLVDRLVGELAARRALPTRELFESFELFERVRRRLRGPLVADLCCGHGLTGTLFAIFSRPVQRVLLVDRRRPDSYAKIAAAALAAAPWIEGHVEYLELPLKAAAPQIPAGCSIVAAHACGARTDRCIEIALAKRSKLAVMPCCYTHVASAPPALRQALGADLSADVDRTYRLTAAGYNVEWSEIPEEISDKNRVIVALPRQR